MVKAHLAANYTIGDPAEEMVEVTDKTCTCGGRLVPLLGKLLSGITIRWDIWIDGNYEHFYRPKYEHPPTPIGEWNYDSSDRSTDD